jgi:hypothetical protein
MGGKSKPLPEKEALESIVLVWPLFFGFENANLRLRTKDRFSETREAGAKAPAFDFTSYLVTILSQTAHGVNR